MFQFVAKVSAENEVTLNTPVDDLDKEMSSNDFLNEEDDEATETEEDGNELEDPDLDADPDEIEELGILTISLIKTY